LNKRAHNVSFGHGINAGIHWRNDTETSMLLREAVALSFLKDRARTYHEKFTVQLTKLDGALPESPTNNSSPLEGAELPLGRVLVGSNSDETFGVTKPLVDTDGRHQKGASIEESGKNCGNGSAVVARGLTIPWLFIADNPSRRSRSIQ